MLKIVVIDDEKLVRKGIVLGTDWGALDCVVVAEAENGQEGIEAIHKFHPDLVICDIKMPVMDGIEMLTTLREEGNQVQVIFLTAYSDFSYAQKAVKLFAADYLLKPFEDGELENAVTQVKTRLNLTQTSEEKENIYAELLKDTGDKSKYIMEALKYIADHYGDEDISVGVIAESLGISEGHLSHLFKKETNYTVMAYILRYRMRAAMKLLSDCRYKVYEVAEIVGYRDITYFSSTFKKIVGISPSEFKDRSL